MRLIRNAFFFFFALVCCGALHAQSERPAAAIFCYQYRGWPTRVLLVSQTFVAQSGHTTLLFEERFMAEHAKPANFPRNEFWGEQRCVKEPADSIKRRRDEFFAKRAQSSDAKFPLDDVIVNTKGLLERDILYMADEEARKLKKPMYVVCLEWSNGDPGYVTQPFVSTYPEYEALGKAAMHKAPTVMLGSPSCEAHVNLALVQEDVQKKKAEDQTFTKEPIVWKTLEVDGSLTSHVDSPAMIVPDLQIAPEAKAAPQVGERAAQKAPAVAEKLPPGKPLQYAYSIFVLKRLDDEKMHSKLCYTRVLTTAGPPGWGDARYEVTDKAVAYAKRRVKAFEDSCHTLTGWELSNFSDPSVSATTVMWNLPGDVAGSGWADKLWHAAASDPENVLIELK